MNPVEEFLLIECFESSQNQFGKNVQLLKFLLNALKMPTVIRNV